MNTLRHADEPSTTGIGTRGVMQARELRAIDAASDAQTLWQIDPAASRVAFTTGKRLLFVKKLTVTGRFADVRGTIRLDEREPDHAHAEVTINVASVDTRQARRDAHLRTADFFDAERYPTMRFTSRRIEAIDAQSGQYRVTGDLTIRDVTREVQLQACYTPPGSGVGAPRIALTLTASLNRRDFGLTWSKPIIKIADELNVSIEVQAVKQP
jgi:polyisoprenoid-binding protein YceI